MRRLPISCVVLAALSAGCLNTFDRQEHVVEGFGSQTGGAADSPGGATVCVVSVGEGTGPGTLYDCLSGGDREVRFEVSEVALDGPNLILRAPYVTLAGETAPPPGLTIRQSRGTQSFVEASHVVLRYFRVIGPGPRSDAGGESHKLFLIDGSDRAIEEVAIHHVSVSAADGAFDALGTIRRVTVERCIFEEMGAAMVIQGPTTTREQISVHHNLFANNEERQPLVRGESQLIDVRNNLVFDWNPPDRGGNGIQVDGTTAETPRLNVIGNVLFKPDGLFGDAAFVVDGDVFELFATDNLVPDTESDLRSNLAEEVAIPDFARVTTDSVADVPAEVLRDVGSGHPEDAALIERVRAALE